MGQKNLFYSDVESFVRDIVIMTAIAVLGCYGSGTN
jgi:hypothetical protein